MNLMVLPNQLYLIVKLYNNRPELLPDTHDVTYISRCFVCIFTTSQLFGLIPDAIKIWNQGDL